MKLLFAAVIALVLLFAVPCMAQDEQQDPTHFIVIGGGVNGYVDEKPAGMLSYGVNIGEGKYLVSNMFMTEEYSTISQAFMQIITRQDYITLFALGEIGVDSGNKTTNLAIGGGMGVEINVEDFFPNHKWLKHVGIMGALKVMKDNDSELANAVKPRFSGGIVYRFGP